MSRLIFQSDRYFVLYDAIVSHGQLLLRSQKNEAHSSNIDVIFFSTRFIQLCTKLNGISIREVDEHNAIGYRSVNEYLEGDNRYLFELTSGEDVYYIAASFLQVFENELSFGETSLGVLEYLGRDKEIAASIKG